MSDENRALEVLESIGYYRFSAYFLPFKQADDSYLPGITFEAVLQTYRFDQALRQLLFPLIEDIELYLRTQLAYYHSHKYGLLGYQDANNYNNRHDHQKFLDDIAIIIRRGSKTLPIKHYQQKYQGEIPIWVIIQYFTLGQLSFFYGDLPRADQKYIARTLFQSTDQNVTNWIYCVSLLRNACAHYSRLYNNQLVARPKTPKESPITLGRDIFSYVCVLRYLYPYVPKWNEEFLPNLTALFEAYASDIDLKRIGFPSNWYDILMK